MKTKLVELSDLTIKQYIERAKQVQKQLQSHKGEYMGIKNRMLARKEQGIKERKQNYKNPSRNLTNYVGYFMSMTWRWLIILPKKKQ